MSRAMIACLASLGCLVAISTASPAFALVDITFTPSADAASELGYTPISFQATDTVAVGAGFALVDLYPANSNYSAGEIQFVQDIYAAGPYELEIYIGGREDIHLGGVTPGSGALFSLNGSDTAATFNVGTYTLPYTYNGSPVSGTITVGVPEASTWALLALGFAGVGLVGYRKRKIEPNVIAAT